MPKVKSELSKETISYFLQTKPRDSWKYDGQINRGPRYDRSGKTDRKRETNNALISEGKVLFEEM